MPLIFNQEAINGTLFALHFQKDTPIVAHQKLIEMTGKKVMNLDQVTEFFEKIDNGEFRLAEEIEEVIVEEEKPEVTLAHILNVPDFVEKYLDMDARFCLRKTCFTIREIINKKLLDIDCLYYKCNGNFIEISSNDYFYVLFKITEGGLNVTNGDIEKVIDANNTEEQIELIQRELTSIFGNGKLRIETLKIENCQEYYFDGEPHIGMTALRNTLKQVSNKLKISNLEYCIEEEDEVFIETLKKIGPKRLKSLKLSIIQSLHNWIPNWIPNWEDFNNLEQWRHLKLLDVRCPQLTVPDIIRFFTHVENVYLKIDSFYNISNNTSLHNSIMELKNVSYLSDMKLLKNPLLKQFKIRADKKIRDSDLADIKASLQQYNTNNATYPCWVNIPYPDSDKKLQILVNKNVIWFKGQCYVEEEYKFEQ
ncbi:hypothetical protein CRE_22926 [Caenorhabditis remanei]|uniref:DUF38 domain-containing protein n=1 Tax=Caenorhabditis remanei TaxID=31234 RepID=E3MW55_CAERE|nr:hypothetical protein CRE_22926 [Caenorhabditis remanei]